MSLPLVFDQIIEKGSNEISPVVEEIVRSFIFNCPEYFRSYPEWVVELPTPEDPACFQPASVIFTYSRSCLGMVYASIRCYIFEEEIRILYEHTSGIKVESTFKIRPLTSETYGRGYSIKLATSHLSHLFSLA